MRSPRFGKSGVHRRKNTFGGLVALAAVLLAVPCRAQSTGVGVRDSAAAAPRDSASADSAAVPPGDSGVAPRDSAVAPRDSAVAPRDSAVAPGDSLARPKVDSAAAPGNPAPPPAPQDSILGAACKETPDGSPDVWLVKFLPSATESERSAVAQEVGGTLLGLSQHSAPGSWYLRVPGRAGDPTVADRLILLAPVLEVGSTRCPS
jgi:hypothetical protein